MCTEPRTLGFYRLTTPLRGRGHHLCMHEQMHKALQSHEDSQRLGYYLVLGDPLWVGQSPLTPRLATLKFHGTPEIRAEKHALLPAGIKQQIPKTP